MIGVDFYYDNQWLSQYEMRMYIPENDQTFVEREIEKSSITSVRSIPNHFSTRYNDALILEFLVIKDVCEYDNQADWVLSGDDVNELRSWLESPKTPAELIVPTADDDMDTHYFGIFTSVQPYVVDDLCYGLTLVFTCNSPYGFSNDLNEIFTVNGSTSAISNEIYNASAEKKEYMKPIVTINSSSVFGANETVQIKNVSDDNNTMEIKLPRGASKIVIDCAKRIITDNNGNLVSLFDIGVTAPDSDNYNFITADRYTFYWLRLVPEFNTVSVKASSGNTVSTVVVGGRCILKSGGF